MNQLVDVRTRVIVATALLALTVLITNQPLTLQASGGGGTGGGGTGGGGTGGGGGGGAVVPPVTSAVIAYSNFGPVEPLSVIGGTAVVGLQAPFTDGVSFFDYLADRFSPAVSGSISKIRLPVHKYDTGGNGQFTLRIFADNTLVPGTLGALIGSFQGTSAQGTSTALCVVNVSNGPRLVSGQMYWIQLVPSAQSREAWVLTPVGITGLQYYIDPYQAIYAEEQFQGCFEISVIP